MTKVTVRVIHVSFGFLDGLNDSRFYGIIVFHLFETGLANLAHGFGLVVAPTGAGSTRRLDSADSAAVSKRFLIRRAHCGDRLGDIGIVCLCLCLCLLQRVHRHGRGRQGSMMGDTIMMGDTTTSVWLSQEGRNCNKSSSMF